MKPFFFLLALLLVCSCNQKPSVSDTGNPVTPAEDTAGTAAAPSEENTSGFPTGNAGEVSKNVSNKLWQSAADPDLTIEIREGRMITKYKGAERTESPFVTFSNNCPGGKEPGEGMNAGFICCMTLATKLETHYLVLTASDDMFEYIQFQAADAKPQVFKRVK